MPESSAQLLQVVEALARGWVVVAANQRTARTLRQAFENKQRTKGIQSWVPPLIVAWDTWLQSLYRQMLLEGKASDLLLNRSQEHTLWRAIISEDASTSSLRPIDALAEAASSAWSLLRAYGGWAHLQKYSANFDTRIFAAWATRFERRLKRRQYLSAAQLAERLGEAVAANQISAPAGVLLVGFDTTTPAQEAFLAALRVAGGEVGSLRRDATAELRILASAQSEEEELRACAKWLRSKLEQNAAAKIAVIVPSIGPLRAEIDRRFRAVLAPELNEITSPAAAPYEFSLGIPLAQTDMVAIAMHVLRWSQGPLPLEDISSLVLSRYFAADGADERLARAEFDAFRLRRLKLLQPRLSLNALHRHAMQWKTATSIPELIHRLAELRRAFGAPELPLLRTHGEWAETTAEILSAANWAPVGQLDSVEFQTRRKWEAALDELATLDFDGQLVPFAQALSSLEQIVQQMLFAPQSRDAPVQIMGPLESAGSTFDAIWFLRANDAEWSTISSPHPLLPWLLQRDLRMPGAMPAHDADLARDITGRIASSAAEVVFSYARESMDGPQRPSPALSGLELREFEASVLAAHESDEVVTEPEVLECEPPIPQLPGRVLRGGAQVLENQAACAFRAFAEARLFSCSLDTAVLGLDAGERGSIVHRVLQLFWTRIKSQGELRALGPEALKVILDECINEGMLEKIRTPEPGWNQAYIDAERQRLRNLLLPWLEYEAKERSVFEVKALEDEHEDVAIGPLHLHVKVDRIDTLLVNGEPAGEIILDYKTSMANPADWQGERPDAPQLPLYAVVAGTPELVGIAFASVRPGKGREIKGFASRSNALPKIPRNAPTDLQVQVKEWRKVLTALAEDFNAGKPEARPKKYPETCKYCQQRLLCRLDLSTLTADESEDTEDAFFEEDNG